MAKRSINKNKSRMNKITRERPTRLIDRDPALKEIYRDWQGKKTEEAMKEMDEKRDKMGKIKDDFRDYLMNQGKSYEVNHEKAKDMVEKKERMIDIDYAKLSQYCKENGIDESMLNTQTKGDQILIMWVNESGEAMRRSLPLAEFAKQKEENEINDD